MRALAQHYRELAREYAAVDDIEEDFIAKSYRSDAKCAITVARAFTKNKRAYALRLIDGWDTTPREEAWVHLVAFRACSAALPGLTYTGVLDMRRVRRRGKVA